MPNGESGIDAINRAYPLVRQIIRTHTDSEVIIVCHGTLMRLITCKLIGIDINSYRRFFPTIPFIGKITLRVNKAGDGGGLEFQAGIECLGDDYVRGGSTLSSFPLKIGM